MNNKQVTSTLFIIVVIIAVAFLGYALLTAPDQRTTTDRVGDAIHALPQGVGKASEQLEDRTPGQKLGDAVKDTGQSIKDNTGN
jgi:hypothetical protein